jgi:hypothetical protein
MRKYVSTSRQSRTLIAQAEELLAGNSLRGYQKKGVAAPPWALVNVLAHSGYEELLGLITRASRTRLGTWDEALCSLAGQLVRMELNGRKIADIQREALVPLEIDLLGATRTAPRSPGDLIAMVSEALRQPRIEQ